MLQAYALEFEPMDLVAEYRLLGFRLFEFVL